MEIGQVIDATGLLIRDACEADTQALARIYAHHVQHGSATFEETPPDAEAMQERLHGLRRSGYPWLVAEQNGRLLGYAYAGPHKARSAYRFTVEDSVYLAPDQAGHGIGSRLLHALIARCEDGGDYAQMMAVIGDSANAASIALHRKYGFHMIGTAKALGYKFGRFIDVVYMQRPLIAASGSKDPS